jgi:hypothetical protein
VTGLTLSRSRPYQKNDNRGCPLGRIEQKDDTLVRAYLGDQRLDTPAQCDALNALYAQMGVYYNLFQPVLHLVGKEVIAGKLKRTWDEARTPSQRLVVTDALTPTAAAGLAALHTATNPRQLRQQIYDALARLSEQPTLTTLAAD